MWFIQRTWLCMKLGARTCMAVLCVVSGREYKIPSSFNFNMSNWESLPQLLLFRFEFLDIFYSSSGWSKLWFFSGLLEIIIDHAWLDGFLVKFKSYVLCSDHTFLVVKMIHFHSFASISSPSALSSCPSNLTLECLISIHNNLSRLKFWEI